MSSSVPDSTDTKTDLKIRPCTLRDLEILEAMAMSDLTSGAEDLRQIRQWYGLLKGLSFFPNPFQHSFCAYVAEQGDRLRGMVQVSPFNKTRSTWRVERLILVGQSGEEGTVVFPTDVGSQLIRHCLQAIWEARTWIMEVGVDNDMLLGLSRQAGFQPLAHLTHWAIAPESLQALAAEPPNLPNLLPVSNADAGLLHQLDTFSMPPTLRQVFDRHVIDFRRNLVIALGNSLRCWMDRTEIVRGYVFQPQRKAAIGYFHIELCRDGSQPHVADLTVHPEYTWLYPELLRQMAQVTQVYSPQSLRLTSADYQSEREEYLQQLGAIPTERSLLLSRSVWHKLREARPLEGLQLSDVLQGLQPSRTPIPSRFSLLDYWKQQQFQQFSAPTDGVSPPERRTPLPKPPTDEPHGSV